MTHIGDIQYLLRRIVCVESEYSRVRLIKVAKLMIKAEEIYQRELKKRNDK